MILPKESEEGFRLLPERHVLSDRILKKTQENNNKKIAYEVIISKHSKKCTFYTLRFGCSFAAVNTIKPQLL